MAKAGDLCNYRYSLEALGNKQESVVWDIALVSRSSSFEFLEETLHLAGQELMRRFGSGREIRYKQDNSLVTDADLASEKIILDNIRKYFPQDHFYSEEAGRSSQERPAGEHVWIIDPLDGTTNFANAYPFFCVSIARGVFGKDGKIEILEGGVIDPHRNKAYCARKGHGAFANGKRLQVAPTRPINKSFLVTGFYYKKGDELQHEVKRFAKVANICQSIRRDGAAALDLALVAEGVYDAFWELGLQPWDLAAGTLLIAESGGVLRNYDQAAHAKYDLEGPGIICGSPSVVSELADLIK